MVWTFIKILFHLPALVISFVMMYIMSFFMREVVWESEMFKIGLIIHFIATDVIKEKLFLFFSILFNSLIFLYFVLP